MCPSTLESIVMYTFNQTFLGCVVCNVVMFLSVCVCVTAVQQERRPHDQKEKVPAAVATSTQRIYIRKDFNSPSAAIPTFSPKVSWLANCQFCVPFNPSFFLSTIAIGSSSALLQLHMFTLQQ